MAENAQVQLMAKRKFPFFNFQHSKHSLLCQADFKSPHLQSVKTCLNKQQPEASQRSANSQSKITAAPSMCHINVGMLIVYL